MQNPETCLKYLSPGRLVRVVEGGGGDCKGHCEHPVYKDATRHRALDWGWGVVVGFSRGADASKELEDGEVADDTQTPANGACCDEFVVYVLLAAREEGGDAGAGSTERGAPRRGAVKRKAAGDDSGSRSGGDVLEPCDWSLLLQEHEGQADQVPGSGSSGDNPRPHLSTPAEQYSWRPVMLALPLSALQAISSVRVPLAARESLSLGGVRSTQDAFACDGHENAQAAAAPAPCDVRSSSTQRSILQCMVRAVSFFGAQAKGACPSLPLDPKA